MNPIIAKTSKFFGEAYVDAAVRLYTDYTVRSHTDNAIKCRYYMDENEIAVMQKYFRQPIVLDPSCLYDNIHPIAKNMHDYAYAQLYKWLENKDSFIEIGPEISRFMKNNKKFKLPKRKHSCCFLTDARDYQRIINQHHSQQFYHATTKSYIDAVLSDNKVNKACKYTYDNGTCYLHVDEEINIINAPEQSMLCLNGAQNCDFQTDYAIAVHSLYGVCPYDLLKIFKKHNLKILKAMMYVPVELLCDVPTNSDYVLDVHNNIASFRFRNDYSQVYRHDVDNWKFYATCSILYGPEFALIFDFTKVYGPLCEITITRIPKKWNHHSDHFQLAHGLVNS